MDAANIKSQLQEERNKALILKKQIRDQEKVANIIMASKGSNLSHGMVNMAS